MKIVKIIRAYKNVSEDEVRAFLYKNLPQEAIQGLEHDDPKTIARTLKMFGINPEEALGLGKVEKAEKSEKAQSSQAS